MKAFSLIELMVVITIVGLLSAAAVPAYSSYVNRAKLSSVMTSVNAMISKATMYASLNGAYPNAAQAGYSLDSQYDFGGSRVDTGIADNSIDPLMNSVFMTPGALADGTCTSSSGAIGFVIRAADFNTGSDMTVHCQYWEIDGIISTKCGHYTFDPELRSLADTMGWSDYLINGWYYDIPPYSATIC